MAAQKGVKKVDLPFSARYKGKQFAVRVKALRSDMGLVQSPTPLGVGDRIVLQAPGSNASFILQLFATVTRQYPNDEAYVLRWDKLVSPAGTTALVEFLQAKLGILLAPVDTTSEQFVDGEMVYYDFADKQVHLPNRGGVLGQPSPTRTQPIPGGPDDFGGPTPPLRRRDNVTGPIGRPEATPRPRPAKTAANAGPANGDDEVIEMYGVKISRKNWEQLEGLNYSGASPHEQEVRRQQARNGGAKAQRTTTQRPPANPDESPERTPGTRRKVSNLLRRLASKLSDEE